MSAGERQPTFRSQSSNRPSHHAAARSDETLPELGAETLFTAMLKKEFPDLPDAGE